MVYLKIEISGNQKSYHYVKYMIDNMMPNKAIKPAPKQKVKNAKREQTTTQTDNRF